MRHVQRITRTLGGVRSIGAAAALALALAPSGAKGAPPSTMGTPATTATKLFLDVHDFVPGKVTAEAVAAAHRKDLATQAKYGVRYQSYWFDEKAGKVYCLAEAPSAEAATRVHREAHGLVANRIAEVSADSARWTPKPGKKLFLDVHHLGAGKVSAADVAGAHQKDLAAQGKHHARYLNYWFDAAEGTVMCLAEAPSAEAALAVHREAHGLMPDAIGEVTEGR